MFASRMRVIGGVALAVSIVGALHQVDRSHPAQIPSARPSRVKLPLVFEAKSNSEARDLLYNFDSLARFQAAQFASDAGLDPRQYVTYNALGLAILFANEEEAIDAAIEAHTKAGKANV